MQDTKSASLVLIAGAVGIGYWWYHLTAGKLASAAASPAPTDPTGGPALSPNTPFQPLPNSLAGLEAFARKWGLPIVSEQADSPSQGTELVADASKLTQPGVIQVMQDAVKNGFNILFNAAGKALLKTQEGSTPGVVPVTHGAPLPPPTADDFRRAGGLPPILPGPTPYPTRRF
jgi:hypothetical protein